MRFVKRDSVPKPSILDATHTQQSQARLVEFFTISKKQQKYTFDSKIWLSVKSTLDGLFQGKCAYCESIVKTDVDHFRPKASAVNIDGKVTEGYWWLAYEWQNLYSICAECNRHKANRFAVKGRRLAYPDIDLDENYLLIDPCHKLDIDENPFSFNTEGIINGETERAKITIDTFGLNRKTLVQRRKKEASDFLNHLEQISTITPPVDTLSNQWINKLLPPAAEFWAMRRYFLFQYRNIKPQVIEQTGRVPEEFKDEDYFATAKLIERIEIRNFKAIKQLDIDFPKPEGDSEPWLVLIGENGVGKSSLLQAVSLALIGQDHIDELGLDPSKLIRIAPGVRKATVKIYFGSSDQPIELKISRKALQVTPAHPQILTLAYGATRMLPKQNNTAQQPTVEPVNVRNLFDHNWPLKDVESWLADTKLITPEDFGWIAASIRDLLLIPGNDKSGKTSLLRRRQGKITFNRNGRAEALYDLCDGYKSVLAYAMDIMMSVHQKWPSIQDAEGLVLIDELETHLHPTWKISIVSLLRKVFPRLSFIVTTHDPLCLRGARPGEVHVMDITEEELYPVIRQQDIPPGMPIENLLLGDWFKMKSTLDEDTVRLIDAHRQLVLEKNDANETQIRTVEAQLKLRMQFDSGQGLFGHFIKTLDKVMAENEQEMDETQLKSKIAEKLSRKLGRRR